MNEESTQHPLANLDTTQNPIVTLPNSLRAQMQRAESLLAQGESARDRGDTALAQVRAQEAMRVLQSIANNAPGFATMLVAAEMGFRGFEFETVEEIERFELVAKKVLGVTVGHDVVRVPYTRRQVDRCRLF